MPLYICSDDSVGCKGPYSDGRWQELLAFVKSNPGSSLWRGVKRPDFLVAKNSGGKLEGFAEGEVAETILAQMGGMGRIRAMLGAKFVERLPGDKGIGIRWPTKLSRGAGNYVTVTLRPDDTYDMEFFHVSRTGKESVRLYEGVYADQLIELFYRQTGCALRL